MKSILQNLRDALYGYKKIHCILYTYTVDLKNYIGSYSVTHCFCCFSPSLVCVYVNSRFDSSQLPPLWTLKVLYRIHNSRILDPQPQSFEFSPHPYSSTPISILPSYPCLGRRSGITQLHISYSIHRTICSSSGYTRS